jgi:hypothetical protein
MTAPGNDDHLRHSREGLTSYVESVINEQLVQLGPVNWTVAASFAGAGNLVADFLPPIHTAKHKYGFRRVWGRYEFAQVAFFVRFPEGVVPPGISKADLVREVNVALEDDPTYKKTGLGRITRNTILKAAGLLD